MTERKRLVICLAALAGVVLAFAATVTAKTTAPKTVVRIDLRARPSGGNPTGGSGTFTLRSGSIVDQGTSSYTFSGSTGTITLMGKKGDLTLRTKSRPSGLEVDSQGLDLWVGTWSIAEGDGVYKGVHGVGAYVGIIGPAYAVALHFEGFRGG